MLNKSLVRWQGFLYLGDHGKAITQLCNCSWHVVALLGCTDAYIIRAYIYKEGDLPSITITYYSKANWAQYEQDVTANLTLLDNTLQSTPG